MSRIALLKFRRDTAANWTSANPTLAAGEPGWETDTNKLKIGDGSTAWNSLPYFGASAGVASLNSLSGALSLVAGANVTISPSGSTITVAAAGGGGGTTQRDYLTQATDLTVTANSAATAQTFIAGNSVTYDGSTRIKIEFWSPSVFASIGAAVIELFRDSTDLGRLGQAALPGGAPYYGVYFDTPAAGAHTYTIKAWRSSSSATVGVTGSSGGVFTDAWYRITNA